MRTNAPSKTNATFNIQEDIDTSQQLKIDIIIMFGKVGLILSIVHEILITLMIPNIPMANHVVDSLWIFTFGGTAYLNYIQEYKYSKYFLLLTGIFISGIAQIAFGPVIELDVIYLLIIFSINYLFEARDKFLAMGLALFTHASVTVYMMYHTPLYEIYPFYNTTYFFFGIILLAFFSYKVLEDYDTLKVIATNQELEFGKKNEQLKRFNHVIINDLKTPLHNIVFFSKTIHSPNSKEEQGKHIDLVIDNGNNLDDILSNLRDIQEIDVQKQNIEKVDLNEIIHSTIIASKGVISFNDIKIEADLFPHIYSYNYPLFIVFRNLVEHILKYNDIKDTTIYFVNNHFSNEQKINIQIHIGNNATNKEKTYTEGREIFEKFLGTKIAINTLYDHLHGAMYVASSTNNEIAYSYKIELPQYVNGIAEMSNEEHIDNKKRKHSKSCLLR